MRPDEDLLKASSDQNALSQPDHTTIQQHEQKVKANQDIYVQEATNTKPSIVANPQI